ncbi:RNA polymerase sigma factor [Nocardia suismassiliense]|uniref:RNA polymerase sigma factor n=1 Tax=Nocardia suismassiliense TaxID=2077092 RepID=A0ABW6R5X5_9NOCA
MTDDQPLAAPQKRFDNLFRTHAPAVFRFALKAFGGDKDRANDIVQEVFLMVWEQFDRDFLGQPPRRAEPLIMKIARCRVIDVWRRTDAVVSVAEYAETAVPMLGLPRAVASPLECVLSDDALRYLRHVLEQHLTETENRVALMAWELELPDTTIAQILGTTVSTVYSHKSRARKKIRAIEFGGQYRIEFDSSGRCPQHVPIPGQVTEVK